MERGCSHRYRRKRRETGIASWIPSFHNGRREFEERVISLVEEKRRQQGTQTKRLHKSNESAV